MSRYIDADALIERWNNMSVRGRTEFDQEIMVAPSIDIVFCKDCPKHKVVPFGENACFYWCDFRCHAVNADNFCSFGGMKTDE